jgi:bisphosphoglycerate-independent phosphoglycerate mutase (AlkP superfamily)
MLIAAGPGIKPGRTENGHILDLAPTILALLNQPVPAGMEGKPLRLMH